MVFYNENNPHAAEWLRELIRHGHIAEGVVDERSIMDVRPDELSGYSQCHFFAGIGVWSYALRQAGWPDDRPVWTGSCPCQPFSAAGKRAGLVDERHLWPAFFHLIRQSRPGTVFGEQVSSKDGLEWFDVVASDLEGELYAVAALDLCAAGVGAPHIRQRLYFVADALRGGTEYGAGQGVGTQAASDGRDRRVPGKRLRTGVEGAIELMAHADQERFGEERNSQCSVRAGGSGTLGLLADTQNSDRWQQHRTDGKAYGRNGHGRGGATSLMGHTSQPGLAQQRSKRGTPCSASQPDQGQAVERAGSSVGELADSKHHGHNRQAEWPEAVADRNQQGKRISDGDRAVGSMADTECTEWWQSTKGRPHISDGDCGGREQAASGFADGGTNLYPGATNGYWRDADWLLCRDGKWRPVRPGTFPLATGVAGRVGRLRGYGNALCAPVAQAFIESYMEIKQ